MTIILVTALVLVAVAIVYGVVQRTLYPKENFTIYEEVCEGSDIYLYKQNISTYRVAEDEFGDKYLVLQNSSTEEIEVGRSFYSFVKGINQLVVGMYETRKEVLSKIKMNKTEEVCEQEIVEENTKICVDKYKDEGNALWCVMSDVISIRWLEENCEECYYDGKWWKKSQFTPQPNSWKEQLECQKYSCSDKYTVEVER